MLCSRKSRTACQRSCSVVAQKISAVIRSVGRETPAGETGLAAGDLIHKINGQPTPDAAALKRVLAGALGQDAVSLVVQRGRGFYRISLPMGS